MDKLWAPWRRTYIQGLDKDREEGCIFCTKPAENNDRQNLILFRGEHSFIIMNKYPYNNGHCMVVPYRHSSQPVDIDQQTAGEIWRFIGMTTTILGEVMRAEGFNVGYNLGRVGGAGIDDHLHCHIVPRWNGDTNFMSVVSKTKVISQGLSDAYDQLEPHFSHREDRGTNDPSSSKS